MFKTIVATATAALVAVTFGASAQAGGFSGSMGANGTSMNGLALNGMSINGMSINGVKSNALHVNGWQNGIDLNGTAPAASSFAIDGIELPAQVR